MNESRRIRMQEEIKKTIGKIIQQDIKDPEVGFVTVIDVNLSGDLRHAKVFVSIYDNKEQKEKTLQALDRATGFIRSELGKKMRFRHVPELVFKFDDSIEHGDNINKILRDLDLGEEKEDDEND